MIIWITGLSGAGKTTLAKKIAKMMRSRNQNVVLLDGDDLRHVFSLDHAAGVDYSREERLRLAMRYSRLCKILAKQKLSVVVATISLFKEVHAWNRANLPSYFEVYLNVPIEELKLRDSKGLYEKYFRGEIKNVSGLDLAVDEPGNPDYEVVYDPEKKVDWLAEDVINKVKEKFK